MLQRKVSCPFQESNDDFLLVYSTKSVRHIGAIWACFCYFIEENEAPVSNFGQELLFFSSSWRFRDCAWNWATSMHFKLTSQ